MSEKKIVHEIKLPTSLTVILAVLAIGVCANAFGPTLSIKPALAQLKDSAKIYVSHSGWVEVR